MIRRREGIESGHPRGTAAAGCKPGGCPESTGKTWPSQPALSLRGICA